MEIGKKDLRQTVGHQDFRHRVQKLELYVEESRYRKEPYALWETEEPVEEARASYL